jgi:chorismate dehydratase
MQTPRIAASSYSNTAPLVWSFLYGSNRGRFELILDNAPARSAELLRQKRVDAALVPVIEYQRIEGVLLIPDVCVGAREKVRSVCLVTKGADLDAVKSVALDVSSKTSVALTQIIFREFLKTEPNYQEAKPNLEKMLAAADCALLIGDPALAVDEKIYRKFDLAETWKNFTGFGFVFAMWMANAEKSEIAGQIDFRQSRDEGLNHLEEIIANYQTEISLAPAEFEKYLSENIAYAIDDSMQRGLSLYFDLARKHHLIERLKPLQFTG